MADIAATYTMSTDPAIKHTVTYESKRSGSVVYYRFKVVTGAITGYSYFGYNLKCDIALNGKTVLSGGTIKNASPSQWSEITTYFPSSTGWYSASGITASTFSVSCKFYSSQTSGTVSSGTRTVAIPSLIAPSGVSLTLSKTKDVYTSTIKLTASISSWGDGSKKAISFLYKKSSENSWHTFSTGTSVSVDFTPSSYGGSNGAVFNFSVIVTNTCDKSTISAVKTFTCASPPSIPTALTVTPTSINPNGSLTLSWSGSADSYEVQVSTDKSNYVKISTTTTTKMTTKPSSYTSLDVSAPAVLYYRVRAKNSYGLYSSYTSAVSATVKNNVMIKVGGVWKSGDIYIKINNVWKQANQVYVKVNNAWKSQ